MEVVTKVACGSIIAGGGGAAGAYGVHRISVAYEKNEEEGTPKELNTESPQNSVEPPVSAVAERQTEVTDDNTPSGDTETDGKDSKGNSQPGEDVTSGGGSSGTPGVQGDTAPASGT